jgi:hypothetical protein
MSECSDVGAKSRRERLQGAEENFKSYGYAYYLNFVVEFISMCKCQNLSKF